MVSDLKTFTNKECKVAVQIFFCFWVNFLRIRRLYNKDQEVIQQGPGGYTTRIRSLLAGFCWYRSYSPHQSRDALSPVRGIFLFMELHRKGSATNEATLSSFCHGQDPKDRP